MVNEHEPSGIPEDESSVVIEDTPVAVSDVDPWFRRRGVLAGIALVLAAGIATLVLTNGRVIHSNSAGTPNMTIKEYLTGNEITSTPVHLGDPGAPNIVIALPQGWSDLGADTPAWAYGAVQFDKAPDANDPPTIVVIVSKLTGDVDPAKILEFAPSELKNLPHYESAAEPSSSELSGFDAVQLAGVYERDGKKRTIAQKTVVIPAKSAVYVLQMNADALKTDAVDLMQATDVIDQRTKITA